MLSKIILMLSGTPPRLDGRTIDYTELKVMQADNPPVPFSFLNDSVWIKVCGTVYQNVEISLEVHVELLLKVTLHIIFYLL